MEHSKNEESELEEGEISEDADDTKRSVNRKESASSTSLKYVNHDRFPSLVLKGPNAIKESSLPAVGKNSTQNRPMYNKRGRNSFLGRVNVSSSYRKRGFVNDNRSALGSQSNLQKLRYDAKTKSTSRLNYVPRISSTPVGYRNVQRSVFHSNVNHKSGNADKFTDGDNDASYEDLLEQYRQIKCRLNDLNEEEAKQSDKGKNPEKSNKSHGLKLGNNKENWQLKQSQAKKSKSSTVCSTAQQQEHTSTSKGRRSSFARTPQVRKRKRPYEYHKPSRKSKANQEKHKQKQHRKEGTKSANEDDDLLELRKQALATLSKQSSCNKIKDSCVESKHDKSEISITTNSQDQNATMFNILGDNYEQVAMDLDSDICPDSPKEVSDNKASVDDPMFGDEIDEEELRKQLLESIAGKKRQQEQAETPAENGLLEPSVTPTLHSEELAEKCTSLDDVPEDITHNIVTTTEPLVINLAEDSSTEEESDKHQVNSIVVPPVPDALPPGLEQLIKDARMQSEKKQVSAPTGQKTPSAVQKLSHAQQLEYRKLKEEIAKRESVLKVESKDVSAASISGTEKLESKLIKAKSDINREQERLQNLKIQLARKRFIARNSQAKVQKLKEQLAAAERVLAVDMQMIKISSAKIKEVQLSLHKKVLNFQAQQRKWLQDSHISWTDKITKMQVNGAAKQKPVSKLVVEKGNSITVVSNTPKAKMTSAEIILERDRLQKLEKEVALQLEELRKKSRKTLSPKKPVSTKVGMKIPVHGYKRKFLVSFDASSNVRSTKKMEVDAGGSVVGHKPNENSTEQKKDGKSQNFSNIDILLGDKMNKLTLSHNHCPLESMKDYEGISKLLDHYNRIPVLLYSYQLCDIFWPKLEKVDLLHFQEDTKLSSSNLNIDFNYSYTSPLLHMHSYRLHPHYVSQEEKSLSSNTYANGLDIKNRLCKFDLLGTCNDDQCTWQHEAHYKLSNEEVIADLLAYAPKISGIDSTDDTQESEVKLIKAAASFLEENPNLPLEDICREAVTKVNLSLNSKSPNFVSLTKRIWKPHTKKITAANTEEWEVPKQKTKELKCHEHSLEDYDFDNLITDADRRYYCIEEEKVIDRLEQAVTENQENVQLWLKLAYKCLHSSESPEVCLEQTLNVLSRALESNQDNPELWQNYLNLYAQHPSSKDVISVCQEALQWCPRYEIWWKYLQLTEGYENKYEICTSFLEHLMSSKMQQFYNEESISHCILEVLLYQVQLSLQVGKYETAIMTFKERLKKVCFGEEMVLDGVQNNSEENTDCKDTKSSNSTITDDITRTTEQTNLSFEGKCDEKISNIDSSVCDDTIESTDQCLKLPVQFMTKSDYCFAWLCYIYVTEFNFLPSIIFQNGEDRLGHVVSKNPFLLDWTQCPRLQNSKEGIKEILAQAACCCMSDDPVSVAVCFPLYFQIVTIELSSKNYALAVEICEKLLVISPTNVSVWLLLSRVYAYQSLDEEVIEVLAKALESVPCDPYICYAASLFHFTKGNIDIAKGILENFVQQFFLIPSTMPSNKVQYTELLYCKLLQHDNGRIELPPKQKNTNISEETKVYLWLNYILYLRCHSSFHSVVLMTFEAALASFHFPDALKIIWWQYLQFSIRHISIGNIKAILKLLNECKITIPTNVSLPHWPGKFKNDFGYHMAVVDFLLSSIECANDKALAVEKFLNILPRNVGLIHRAVHCYLVASQEDMALSLMGEVLHMEVFSSYLWRIAVRLILKTKDKQEAHKFYNQAVQLLPYSCILWLEYFLYEVSENHLEHIEKIKNECRKLQINCIPS